MLVNLTPEPNIAPSHRLELFFLGSPQASLPGQQEVRFSVDNSLLLLAFLAIDPHKIHRRDELAALLYPDHSEKQASVNLRQILLRLRRAIGDEDARPPYMLGTQLSLQFNADSSFWLDVLEFEASLSAVQMHPHRRLEVCRDCMLRLDRAVELYRGDFLSGVGLHQNEFFTGWLNTTRDDLRRKAVWALQNLSVHHFQRRQFAKSQAYLSRLARMDPFNEQALRLEMQILMAEGYRNLALQRFHEFKLKLLTELEVRPEPETLLLAEALRSGQALETLQANPARKDTILTLQDFSATALPNTLTPFIGRAGELAQITRWLSSQDCRLITLTGPGGIGKTRLAMRAAADDAPAWADGVWLVLLENASADPSSHSIEYAIGQAIGVTFDPAQPLHIQLYNFLREKELLLLLDNFEQVIGQADFVKALLNHAPRLKVFATSRQRLGIRGEQIIELQGLDFPPPNDSRPLAQADLLELPARYAAIQLFLENARRTRPDFAFDHQTAPAVTRICQRLAGLPLGIELASRWLRVYPCAQILEQIEQNVDFLTACDCDVPARHASLRAVFEYSWNLLSLEERQALTKAAAFQDGFTPETAAQAAGVDVRMLALLRDKSVLQECGSGQFRLDPQLHPFAAEKLSQEMD